MIHIETFSSGPLETNGYLVQTQNHCVLIDAPPQVFPFYQDWIEKRKLTPQALLLTHSHWDHIADAHALKQAYQIPIYVHALDVPNLQSPGADQIPLLFPITPTDPDVLIEDGDILSFDTPYHVLHTPGHSRGGVCFYLMEHHILFSGDTLFQGSFGNLAFAQASRSDMCASLKKLAKLPAHTRVYPGHRGPTTLGAEHFIHHPETMIGG